MNVRSLKRDAARALTHLTELENGSVVTNAACKIQIPERFTAKNLAVLGSEVFILGFFPIIFNEEYYGVSNTIAMMRILPSSTERVVIESEPYYEFSFEAGDKVFFSTALVVNDTLAYYMYDEFISKGNIPWYMDYYDMAKMFETADLHAGVNLGGRSIVELIISTIARDPDDMTRLYRHRLSSHDDVRKVPPVTVPFRSVIWNTSDTTSKLNGAYFSDSINSALVNPSESVEVIEELLRT
ncbi:virion structural protein [Pseudomonas phage PhiPA3]|uniref:Uncharacterized protein 206 n=1 Tax=Pseudomonas phage PhiPA3 TaxID=998086 RepID=F8SJ49_BPPA3|nr:virion structural protein [Pseudomonas phage PhiPA3]AEH03629.1 hypothetical protein [Pseudomonas phage PhiPA3]